MSSNKNDFLDKVFQHMLDIAKGDCYVDDEAILAEEDEMHRHILYGLLYMHEDIEISKKEMKQKMEAEYQMKLLEAKNKELQHFVYAASHDLKEPIRTLSGFSHLLITKYSEGLEPKAKEYLSFINTSAKRMTNLINSLLEYATLGNSEDFEVFRLNELINEITSDLGSLIEKRNAKIVVKRVPRIKGNRTLLRLLFQNLIGNAIKFNKPDVNPIVEIGAKQDMLHWEIYVKDNGIGIDEQYLDGIFQIFNRASKSKEYEGSGIGLAQCKKIVELHNGTISVTSQKGVGSKFVFTLDKIKE